jgi:hypothetical protein
MDCHSDETWVQHYEPASEHQSMKWKDTSSPKTNKFKSVLSASKMMLMLFQDFNGLILKHYQDHGQNVSSTHV